MWKGTSFLIQILKQAGDALDYTLFILKNGSFCCKFQICFQVLSELILFGPKLACRKRQTQQLHHFQGLLHNSSTVKFVLIKHYIKSILHRNLIIKSEQEFDKNSFQSGYWYDTVKILHK